MINNFVAKAAGSSGPEDAAHKHIFHAFHFDRPIPVLL
jgi:hypothetical protein